MHPRQRLIRQKPFSQRNIGHSLSDGLVTAFLMNEMGGLSVHDVAGGRKGTYAIAPTWSLGEHGPQVLLSGSNRFELGIGERWGRVLGGAQGVTTAMRLRRTAAGGSNRYLFEMTRGSASTHKMRCYFDTTDKIFWRAIDSTGNNGSFTSTNAFSSTTEWYTIVCTADLRNGTRALYVNGRPEAIADTSMNWPADASFNFLAANTRDTIGYDAQLFSDLDAQVNYFMVWRRPITADEAMTLHVDPFAMFNQPLSSRYADTGGAAVPFFLVDLSLSQAGETRVGKTRKMVIEALTAAGAKAGANSIFEADLDWDQSTTTELVAGQAYEGSTWRVIVSGAEPGDKDLANVTYTAVADDTLALVGGGVATALNTVLGINTAAFSGGTLTVAGAADGLGARSVKIEITPEGAQTPMENVTDEPVGTITHEGVSGAALTIALTDTGIPRLIARC